MTPYEIYIDRAGGFTRSAAKKGARIIKADGRVIRRRVVSHRIEVGDAIIIPERVIRDRDWLKMVQSSMALIASTLTTIFILTKLD